MFLNTVSGPVAAYLLTHPPTPDESTECKRWIIAEHFPEQECSVVLSPTLPADLPEERTEFLRVAQASMSEAVFMVVRPIKP